MKRYIYLAASALLAILPGCSVENPFNEQTGGKTGVFHKSALEMEVRTEENLRVQSTRAVNTDDFIIQFFHADDLQTVVKEFTYGSMPSMVELQEGTYIVEAKSGPETPAAWNKPWYWGFSPIITIDKNTPVVTIDPVVCKMKNVKVDVVFDSSLGDASDLKAEVMVERAPLVFTKGETRSAYFHLTNYLESNKPQTLMATFSGTVGGSKISQTLTRDVVLPGNAYVLTFRASKPDTSGTGNIGSSSGITINADIIIKDVSGDEDGNLRADQEEVLGQIQIGGKEDLSQGENNLGNQGNEGNQGGEDPGNDPGGDDPGTTTGPAPTITASKGFDLAIVNEIEGNEECELYLVSETGITGFTVDIDSETLTADILEGVGLQTHLDLVNPGNLEEALRSLKFPVGADVKGKKAVTFSITEFLPLLGVYGSATHKFILKVTDANGTTNATLTLKN